MRSFQNISANMITHYNKKGPTTKKFLCPVNQFWDTSVMPALFLRLIYN